MTKLIEIKRSVKPCIYPNIKEIGTKCEPNENTIKRKNELIKCYELPFCLGISPYRDYFRNEKLFQEYIDYIYKSIIKNHNILYKEKKHIVYAKEYDPDLQDLIFCFREKGDICVNSFMNTRYWILTINSIDIDNISFYLEHNYKSFCERLKIYLEKTGVTWHTLLQ